MIEDDLALHNICESVNNSLADVAFEIQVPENTQSEEPNESNTECNSIEAKIGIQVYGFG